MRVSLLAAFLMFGVNVVSQISEKKNLVYKNGNYDVISFHVDSSLSQRLSVLENITKANEKVLFDSLAKDGLFFAMNAGIVDSACNLLGMYAFGSNEIQSVNRNSGSGNFYLDPNGILGSVGDKFEIKKTADFTGTEHYIFALQSGPLLLNANAIHPLFSNTSKNKNLRSGVGLLSDSSGQSLLFAISNTPVTFYDFAEFFKSKLKCTYALSLESGSNVSAHFPSVIRIKSATKVICKYIYIRIK